MSVQPNFVQGTNKYLLCAIPFIVAPTGSMANNGAITLGTALSFAYPNAYVYLPANAIVAGSAAGWYFCQFSSTTVGTVYNNPYSSGVPVIPASLVPFVTTGPGAYTGVTTAVTALSITLDPNSLGPNGLMRYEVLTNINNNTDAKTITVSLGGSNLSNANLASVGSDLLTGRLFCQGSNSQPVSQAGAVASSNIGVGTAGSNVLHSAVGLTGSPGPTLAIGLTLATATDYMVVEAFLFELFYGP